MTDSKKTLERMIKEAKKRLSLHPDDNSCKNDLKELQKRYKQICKAINFSDTDRYIANTTGSDLGIVKQQVENEQKEIDTTDKNKPWLND
jgi:FixJ family two-component response regulator